MPVPRNSKPAAKKPGTPPARTRPGDDQSRTAAPKAADRKPPREADIPAESSADVDAPENLATTRRLTKENPAV